jgi:hypothetical protein
MRAGLWWFKVGVMGKRLDEEAKGEYRDADQWRPKLNKRDYVADVISLQCL